MDGPAPRRDLSALRCVTPCRVKHDPARTLSLRVPRDLRPRLDTLARARGTSRHACAVEALTAGVEALTATATPPPPEAA